MAKKVLITYSERVKEMIIPPNSGNEIEFLADRFFVEFGVRKSLCSVTFQRFEKEWNCFVEVNSGSGVIDREKLKAVVEVSYRLTPPEGEKQVE